MDNKLEVATSAEGSFERKESDDVLAILLKAVEEAATTEDEKKEVEAFKQRLDTFINSWKNIIRDEQKKAQFAGKEFDIMPEFKRRYWTETLPTKTADRDGKFYPAFEIFEGKKPTAELFGAPVPIPMTDFSDFMERILKNIGTLKGDEKINDLRLKPSGSIANKFPESGGYDKDFDVAMNFPTNLDGIHIETVGLGSPKNSSNDNMWIMAAVELDALIKMIDRR